MKKFILILVSTILVIIASILLTRKNTTSDLSKLTLSEVTHSVFYSPLYVAIENGYFEEEGIELELVLTPGADKVAASILSGDADIGFSGPEATIYVYNNSNEKLLTFASLTKRDGQFIVGDCSLKGKFTMKELEGKTVLAGRSGGMPLMMFNYAMKESNIDVSKVTIDSSVEFAGLAGAYMAHQGDFVNLFEPNAFKVEQSASGCVLASLGNISGVVPYTAFYAKEDFISNNKILLQKFNKAINKGLVYVHENSYEDIAKSIIGQFADTSLKDLIVLVTRYKDADSWYDSTFVNENDYDRLQDIMLYGKTITNKIDSKMLITNEFNK